MKNILLWSTLIALGIAGVWLPIYMIYLSFRSGKSVKKTSSISSGTQTK